MSLKKVKEIYFNDGVGLPIFVMMNGESKSPYQMNGQFIWLTSKEHSELSDKIKENIMSLENKPKSFFKKLFTKTK